MNEGFYSIGRGSLNINGKFYCGLDYQITDFMRSLEEENKQLKEQLQQKEDIINKANKYVISHLKQDMLSDFTGANYIQEYIEEPDGLLEILDNKGE